jgi:flagellar basal-body rod protein FlgB
MDVVHKAMDGLSRRHMAIASNLANVDTPNYHRKNVSFEQDLKRAVEDHHHRGARTVATNRNPLPMRTTRTEHYNPNPAVMHLEHIEPRVSEDSAMRYRLDGNSVDVDNEMAQMAKNTQRYMALANLEKRMVEGLKSIISNAGGAG